MKKFYSILLAIGVIILLIPSEVSAQTYTYDQSKSSLNVGNPGTLRGTAYDYTTTGGTIIHRGNSGPNGSTGSYNSTNYWSVARAIPFPFKFYGATVDSFCLQKRFVDVFNKRCGNGSEHSIEFKFGFTKYEFARFNYCVFLGIHGYKHFFEGLHLFDSLWINRE